MFSSIVLVIICGICAGVVTGLTPGIHVNLVALLCVSSADMLLEVVTATHVACFIISLAITHSFLDSIPGVYLGAPDEAQALAALPGHRMLLAGEGHTAVVLTLIGSFFSLVCCVLLSPLFFAVIESIYSVVRLWIAEILIITVAYLILKDKNWIANLFMFVMSGTLGYIVLNIHNQDQVLFPLLSGLFGISLLLMSLSGGSTPPKQKKNTEYQVPLGQTLAAVGGATVVGFMASFLPGFGSSQAAILATQVLRNLGDKGFLILTGGINTVNMALSLVTLVVLDKARNGAVLGIRTITGIVDIEMYLYLIAAVIIAGCLTVPLAMMLSRSFALLISKVNYRALVLFVITFITVLVYVFSGWLGFLILIASVCVGLVATTMGVGKNHLMGCLLVPVIIFFL